MTNDFERRVREQIVVSEEGSVGYGAAVHDAPVAKGQHDGAPSLSDPDVPLPVINCTNRLVFTASIERARASFARHVMEAGRLHRERVRKNNLRDTRVPLDVILRNRLQHIDGMNEEDFVGALKLCDGSSGRMPSESAIRAHLNTMMVERFSPNQFQMITCWLRYVFCQMWADRCVLLPLNFRLRGFLTKDGQRKLLPRILTCHLDNLDAEESAFGQGLTLASQFYDFALIDIDVYGAAIIDILKQQESICEGLAGIRTKQP